MQGVNLHRFCEGYGIRVHPVRKSAKDHPPNVIYGGRIVARMLRDRGPDHTGLVLMCIQASNPRCLYGDVILAVSRFLTAHQADLGNRRAAVDAFSQTDLMVLRQRAAQLARGKHDAMTNLSAALSVIIANTLLRDLAA